MASGSTGTPWNIPFPVGQDQYALTTDLAAMASQTSLGLSQAVAAQGQVVDRVEYGRLIPQADNLDSYRTEEHRGRWYVADGGQAPSGVLPFGSAPFTVDVIYVNQSAWQIAYRGGTSYAPTMERKWIPGGAARWTAWEPRTGGGGGVSTPTAQRDVLMQRSRIRHGGRIGTAGKTVVGLSFDHGFANFRDHVLPHLIRLGLPATVAINTSDLGTGENAGVSYPELQEWAIQHGIELANHSRSHGDAVGDAAIEDAILGSLELLHQHCPLVTVDAYIMPGVSGTGYDGFGAGLDDSLWWTHVAGRTILGNHAVVTAALLGQAVPADGQPVQTVDRAGFDYGSWATTVQNRVASLAGTGMGMQIFMHPSRIDAEGYITEAQVVAMLEWLAAERDAGRIEVLTVSGAAWADASASRRTDLAAGATWVADEASIALAPLREWARGSQWVLSAEMAAEGTLSIQDDTGALNASVTTGPGTGRLCFTIPADASTLTISAGPGATVTPI